MSHRTRLSFLVAAFGLALGLPGLANAQNPTLNGTVGPGFTISLTNPDGSRVTQLNPGTYTIVVQDRSDEHNFHLSGPGVDVRTDVEFVGTQTYTVTFTDGAYEYHCDPHPTTMNGSFTAGVAAPPPPPPARTPRARAPLLRATVGPGFTISLRTASGRRVRSLRAGVYRIRVRDRSSIHNFHLRGRRVNKRTGVPFTGTVTWRVRLVAGRRYRYVCDPHDDTMRGSFRVRARSGSSHAHG